MKVQNGAAVSMFYSLKLERTNKLVASQLKKPLNFIVGKKKLILGLDNFLIGLKSGEKKSVKISPESGFGQRDEELVLSLDRADVAEHLDLRKGMILKRRTKSGKVKKGIVRSFDDDTVMVDFNHPLAGETLHFETEIIDVRQPSLNA